jgi:hypothetical protein
MQDSEASFSIQHLKRLENAHIFLWLIKDSCWVMEFKVPAFVMIFPTLSMAFYLLIKSWSNTSERIHNWAICFWIMANSVWMIGEFSDKELRPYAAVLFSIGLMSLLSYYLRKLFFK